MKPLKYKNKKTLYNGFLYDSKYEASVAMELDLRLKANEFIEYEKQYKIHIEIYAKNGDLAIIRPHKVDFRLKNYDGTYTLLEAKGKETTEYRHIRNMILTLWLPFHPDYSYEVVSKNKGLVEYKVPRGTSI